MVWVLTIILFWSELVWVLAKWQFWSELVWVLIIILFWFKLVWVLVWGKCFDLNWFAFWQKKFVSSLGYNIEIRILTPQMGFKHCIWVWVFFWDHQCLLVLELLKFLNRNGFESWLHCYTVFDSEWVWAMVFTITYEVQILGIDIKTNFSSSLRYSLVIKVNWFPT